MNDEFNTVAQDAQDEFDKNHLTESDEFDATVQVALDRLVKNQLSRRVTGVIKPIMMNLYIAGGDMTGGRPEIQVFSLSHPV